MKFAVLLSVVCVFGAVNANKGVEKTELQLLKRLVQMLARELEEMDSVDFIRMWREFDTDGNGFIEKGELDKLARETFMDTYVDKQDILEQFDVNHDGKLSMREMTSVWPVEKNFLKQFEFESSKLTAAQVIEIFIHYDKSSDRAQTEAYVDDIFNQYNQENPNPMEGDDILLLNYISQYLSQQGNSGLEGDEMLGFVRDLLSMKPDMEINMARLEAYSASLLELYDQNHDNKIQLEELAKLMPVS